MGIRVETILVKGNWLYSDGSLGLAAHGRMGSAAAWEEGRAMPKAGSWRKRSSRRWSRDLVGVFLVCVVVCR